MNPGRWKRVEEIYQSAVERPNDERESYVEAACAGDSDLRVNVLELLATKDADTAQLRRPVLAVAQHLGGSRRSSEGESLSDARIHQFQPGFLFANRYRIVGLVGRGAMGEVYRADDLTIGQPVALKFLRAPLDRDPTRIARFIAEVGLARQVSHPNVCRMYDIGDADGQQYLSMEYIDGESLASLLFRVGRLPLEKVVEIARQLCAGLAAAHDRGVLHRDLKPANIMLDGRGHARITDFGIAVSAADAPIGEIAGTPAYMAPEQITGGQVTTRTDLFALGLILYELLTGKRCVPVDTLQERWTRRHEIEESLPRAAARDIAPPLSHLVVLCLQPDPTARPTSVRSLAAALPGGGDPLQAAVAAGETPSPEMVASAEEKDGLSTAAAWTCLGLTLAGLVVAALYVEPMMIHRRFTLGKPPDVLVDRAQQIVRRLGYTDAPTDTAHWFVSTDRYADIAIERSGLYELVRRSSPTEQNGVFFIYRQSPRYLVPENAFGVVLYREPPADVAGMADVVLDPIGRLVRLTVVPAGLLTQSSPAVDWSIPFGEAGLEIQRFTRVAPRWVPPVAHNSLLAWDGAYPDETDRRLHVTAAAWNDRPVFFDIDTPDVDHPVALPVTVRWGGAVAEFILGALTLTALGGAGILARRNIRLQRWDRSGALRLGTYVLGLTMFQGILRAHHVPLFRDEYVLFAKLTGWSLYTAGCIVLAYIAFEPLVRKRWPRVLISWTRMLAGRFHDRRVGRDILVGAVAGVAVVFIRESEFFATRWFGASRPVPYSTALDGLGSWNQFVSLVLFVHIESLTLGLALLLILLVLRIALRTSWIAVLASVLFVLPATVVAANHLEFEVLQGILVAAALVFVLLRFGLVALLTLTFVANATMRLPITLNPSDWYIDRSVIVLLCFSALAVYGFHASFGGHSIFGHKLLDD